jgi:hypothetical protein
VHAVYPTQMLFHLKNKRKKEKEKKEHALET